ncbi:acid sphingomyelinase-like phosphodiesterase 3b [Cylas formicarius]|uniref:acid sphingomyelinase-like phosphodiesterase 3b n=1 Tax=Cylas formicarius TaxID=197179 RepID=UPI002958B54D|nr:acid sphingomyelinase-like phosphodiesterase 3b [Cylas formicarius]
MNMWWLSCFGLLLPVVARRDDYEKTGYFWHITDIHYDPHYSPNGDYRKSCWRHDNRAAGGSAEGSKAQRRSSSGISGRFGDYGCDTPWELIESAARFMKSKQNDNVEFVLWTGDGLSHFASKHLSESRQLELLQRLTDLLGKTFPAQFVFPSLGHDDPASRRLLGRMWSRWLPTDSMKTFETGGYYIIERKMLKLQIVVINTNLMKRGETDRDASEQWKWLETVLNKFEKSGETVYLVGHVPPGQDERQKSYFPPFHGAYTDYNNRKYIELVGNFSSIIAGQFFGHYHSDSFRVIHDKRGKPISWLMIAPSIAPKRPHVGPNNPAIRMYKFNKDTGQIFDYTQYYLDLSTANAESRADWSIEYNFTTYYNLNEITAQNLHHLTNKFIYENSGKSIYASDRRSILFERYYKANSVRVGAHPRESCDSTCVQTHYCSITCLDHSEFEYCLKAKLIPVSGGAILSVCDSLQIMFTVCLSSASLLIKSAAAIL